MQVLIKGYQVSEIRNQCMDFDCLNYRVGWVERNSTKNRT